MPGFRQQRQTGDIFGGWATAQVDLAGSVLPARYMRGRTATVAVAVNVSHLTRFGRTATTVAVEVCAELSAARFGSIPQGDAGGD